MENSKDYKPIITVITSVLNGVNTIEAAILSVINQSYANIEYIVIDGGSTDGTLDIIAMYNANIAYWKSEPDKGIYDAWNKGLEKATGDWVAFLGADDEYQPDALQQYVSKLQDTKDYLNVDIITSRTELFDVAKKSLGIIGKPWEWTQFRKYMCTAHVGSLHSISFFKKYGNYDLNFKVIGDYELLLRPLNHLKAAYLDEVTVKMQLGGISNISTKALGEVYKAKIKNGARSTYQAKVDLAIAYLKFYFRKFFLTKY